MSTSDFVKIVKIDFRPQIAFSVIYIYSVIYVNLVACRMVMLNAISEMKVFEENSHYRIFVYQLN
jgi:hypothetical protein